MKASALTLNHRFRLGFIINTSFMMFEYAVGLISGSLILIADATHNLTDSITLAVSWLANRIAKRPADSSHSLGHGRATVLAAFINSSILAGVSVLIFAEAYQRFMHPVHLKGGVIAVVAVVGIFANGSVAALFRKDRADLNVRAAYTNMAFDTVFSIAALIAGLLILWTHQTWIDPVISSGVAVGLLYAAFGILRHATHIFLEGVPKDVQIDEIEQLVARNSSVKTVENIYAWALSSNEYVLCCTITPKETGYKQLQELTRNLKRELGQLGFAKVIIEVT